jgi:hypothetical protein
VLAYFHARHLGSGAEAQVPSRALNAWRLKDTDPLAGRRSSISKSVRNGATAFTLPANVVAPGEIYHLSCGVIRIDSVTEKIVKGQRSTEWVVKFTRLMEDRLYFLRTITPSLKPGEKRGTGAISAAEAEEARIAGNYRSKAEPEGDPLPTVPPNWEDKGRAMREQRRQESVGELIRERQAHNMRAQLGRVLKGLSPDAKVRVLSHIASECEKAVDPGLKDVA